VKAVKKSPVVPPPAQSTTPCGTFQPHGIVMIANLIMITDNATPTLPPKCPSGRYVPPYLRRRVSGTGAVPSHVDSIVRPESSDVASDLASERSEVRTSTTTRILQSGTTPFRFLQSHTPHLLHFFLVAGRKCPGHGARAQGGLHARSRPQEVSRGRYGGHRGYHGILSEGKTLAGGCP